MEEKLVKKFYLQFIPLVVFALFFVSLFVYVSVHYWKEYINNEKEILWPMLSSAMAILSFILFMIGIIPCLKDLKSVINKSFTTITAVVVGYNKKELAGEPPETVYNPIFKVIDSENRIELPVSGAEINKTYKVVYLKHTKIANIKEIN